MRRLEIVHVAPYFSPAWAYGGIPRLAYELAREQGRMGHNVKIITTDALDSNHRHPESGATLRLDGGALEARYLRNISNKLAYFDQLFLPVGLSNALEELAGRAEIIHIHGHRHVLEIRASKWAVEHDIPYVITANGTAPRIERREIIKAALDLVMADGILQRAAGCIAVAQAELPQYIGRGVKRERIRIIPNGIDVKAFENHQSRGAFRKTWNLKADPVVLYLGKITPRKGLKPLVAASNILRRERPIQLVIAGNDMGYLDVVRAEVRRLKMSEMVTYTGLVEGREKIAAYVDADVTVYPSQHEIFGLVPFESILCGTPVVVSDDCGCGEIVAREQMGEVVRYGDIDGLARAILRTLDNPETGREPVERGRKFIRDSLDWSVVAAQTVSLYTEILDGSFPGKNV